MSRQSDSNAVLPFRWVLFALGVIAIGFAVFVVADRKGNDLRDFYLAQVWPVVNGIERRPDTMIEMRDGVRLATDLYIPREREGPVPVIYVQTTYSKQLYFGGLHALQMFARDGYAIAVQDIRGRFASEGDFNLYETAAADGWDTLDWLSSQPWSNGRVGTFGCSALGEIQYILAEQAHPAHKAMIVEAGGGAIGAADNRHRYFGIYEGGVLNLSTAVGWFSQSGALNNVHRQKGAVSETLLRQLPVESLVRASGSEPTLYEDYVSHPPGHEWWKDRPYLDEAKGFAVPGLHVNSWFDIGVEDTITLALGEGLENAAEQWTVISPAIHCDSEELLDADHIGDLPVHNAKRDYESLFRRFFDSRLKGEGDWQAPRLETFVLGENQWRSFDSWPPAESAELDWFLGGRGPANSGAGDGVLSLEAGAAGVDTFVYDPMNPVPTRGGVFCCTGNPEDVPGSFDQSESAARDDVLVFDSSPLERPLTVTGPVSVTLHVGTSAPDTDFTAKLVDVHPDGRAMNIQDGVFRLRYRDGYDQPKDASPGQRYEITISLRATAYRFAAGHRIRLEVSSSNFPRLARNLNTGEAAHVEENPVVATNSVFHGVGAESRLTLSVLHEIATDE